MNTESLAFNLLWMSPFLAQAGLMFIDEWICHERRGLGRWERIGHPVDTLTVIACYGLLTFSAPSTTALLIYLGLSVVSCLVITKDEGVHSAECGPLEQWIHALLFILHPVTLGAAAWAWWNGRGQVAIPALLASTCGVLLYQWIRWNRPGAKWPKEKLPPVNNAIYDDYGDRWYTADDDPVALLRAESRAKTPWIQQRLETQGAKSILDVGCGAGFTSNALAASGFQVTGVDLSLSSLEAARRHDSSGRATYVHADANHLPFPDAHFDAVCSLDFLEHVEDPARAIREIARVLKPGGLFFFHTFNRNWMSWLVVIKLVEWLVANTPRDMHVLRLFIKPRELNQMNLAAGMKTQEITGLRPVFSTLTWESLRTGVVPKGLRFCLTRSTALSYLGMAKKQDAR